MAIEKMPEDLARVVTALLTGSTKVGTGSAELSSLTRLGGDGSNRGFWRLAWADGRSLLAIAPAGPERQWLREARAGYRIGRHLHGRGVPVPAISGYDPASGILLCEDLGTVHLHDIAVATDWNDQRSIARLRDLYYQAVKELAGMQCLARTGFDPGWCWDTPRYDRDLMLARESGYFLRACWQGLLGQDVPEGLTAELTALAEAAAGAPADFFLHRDFQSRNIMVKDGQVRIIDYQGGRLGPLAYDLASLLLDPYAGLPQWLQEELYQQYLGQLQGYLEIDADSFARWYVALALQRNLQIVGAYAYLSSIAGKPFFRQYLAPALASLAGLARICDTPSLPILYQVVQRARELLPRL
ncbi:MAG: aminoglycoside phosphotransferase family protein [Desulfopila sp.]